MKKKEIEDVFAFEYINLRRMIEIFVRDLDVVVFFLANTCVYADWKCEKDKCLSFILEIRANDLWSYGACVSVGVRVVLFMRMINSNMHSAAAATVAFKWNWCKATNKKHHCYISLRNSNAFESNWNDLTVFFSWTFFFARLIFDQQNAL